MAISAAPRSAAEECRDRRGRSVSDAPHRASGRAGVDLGADFSSGEFGAVDVRIGDARVYRSDDFGKLARGYTLPSRTNLVRSSQHSADRRRGYGTSLDARRSQVRAQEQGNASVDARPIWMCLRDIAFERVVGLAPTRKMRSKRLLLRKNQPPSVGDDSRGSRTSLTFHVKPLRVSTNTTGSPSALLTVAVKRDGDSKR